MASVDQLLDVLASTAAHARLLGDAAELAVQTYLETDSLESGLWITLALAAVVFLLGLITSDHSWVDRLWSLTPVGYAWHFALHDWARTGATPGPRLLLMATLVTLWGARLTYNFARKDGYRVGDGEDYRWKALREIIHYRVLFEFFNATFISAYQSLLIFSFVLPAYVALRADGSAPALTPIDATAAVLFLAALVLETVADQQQWIFQNEKYHLKGENKPLKGDYKLGFLTHGLFAYSRHPNFFGEQCVWLSFYLFSVGATGQWLNWSITGAVLLVMLFQGSTWFTEMLTAKKYPAYREYQKTTSRLLPWFPSKTKIA